LEQTDQAAGEEMLLDGKEKSEKENGDHGDGKTKRKNLRCAVGTGKHPETNGRSREGNEHGQVRGDETEARRFLLDKCGWLGGGHRGIEQGLALPNEDSENGE